MRALLTFVVATLSILPLSAATLSDIHRDKLPQDEAVQHALDQIAPVEELVDHWSGAWSASIPKDQVQTMLGVSLAALRRASHADPKNEEIFLAIALLDHYSYNVDVDGADEQMREALDAAQKIEPADYRLAWFLAYHQCQDLEAASGMKALEALEAAHPPQSFPISFWDDYIACSIVTNVPSHGLRAFDRIREFYPSMVDPRESMKQMLVSEASHPILHRPMRQKRSGTQMRRGPT